MIKFHAALSEDSVYYRYLNSLKLSQRIAHERLARICHNDYDQELALVAMAPNRDLDSAEILGVGRVVKSEAADEAEFALVVTDRHQNSGLGTLLLRQLIPIAQAAGFRRLVGFVLPSNRPMLHLASKLGFRHSHAPGDPVVRVELLLRWPKTSQ